MLKSLMIISILFDKNFMIEIYLTKPMPKSKAYKWLDMIIIIEFL